MQAQAFVDIVTSTRRRSGYASGSRIEGARLSYGQNCESMQRVYISPAKRVLESRGTASFAKRWLHPVHSRVRPVDLVGFGRVGRLVARSGVWAWCEPLELGDVLGSQLVDCSTARAG